MQAAIEELHRQGQMRLDADGRIIGSAGLSIQPDPHEIELEGRKFWTWCAYDFFGIFAALAANGHATTVMPDTGQTVRITFRDGHPQLIERRAQLRAWANRAGQPSGRRSTKPTDRSPPPP